MTTPATPEDGVIAGVRAVLGEAGVAPATLDLVIHGTTLATNALIERKGARTVLITTQGLMMGCHDQAVPNRGAAEGWAWLWNPPLRGGSQVSEKARSNRPGYFGFREHDIQLGQHQRTPAP